jgi:hypothetical protein
MISNHLPTDYQNFIALSRYADGKKMMNVERIGVKL